MRYVVVLLLLAGIITASGCATTTYEKKEIRTEDRIIVE